MKKLNVITIERTIEALEENKASAIVDAIKRFKETEAEDTLKGIAATGKNLEEIGGAMKAYLSYLLEKEKEAKYSRTLQNAKVIQNLQTLQNHNEMVRRAESAGREFIETSIRNHQF